MAFVYFRDVNTSVLATLSQAANLRSLHWGEINAIGLSQRLPACPKSAQGPMNRARQLLPGFAT